MNTIKIYALLMIALVISMPVYSSQALAASLQVQKNSGEDNIGGYLDAAGDTWTLQVLAEADGEQVVKENVRVNGAPFDSCTDQGSLGKICTYSLSRPDGFSSEGARSLRLELRKQSGQVIATQQSQIILDGSGPTVVVRAIQKENNNVEVVYTVREQPTACVGLQRLQIKHGSTVLKTIEGDELKEKADSYCTTPQQGIAKSIENENETVTIAAAASGMQRIEVVATDRMGHVGKGVVGFVFDAFAPVIKEQNFSIGTGGRYAASGEDIVPVTFDVLEDGPTLSAKISLSDVPGTCRSVGTENNKTLYRCSWESVRIQFASSLSVTVDVSDGRNKVSRTLVKQFTIDDDEPRLEKFETKNAFAGQNFVSRDKNTFVATFTESGSGMDASKVLANFEAINSQQGNSQGYVAADACTQSGSTWTCTWNDISAERVSIDGSKTVTIVEAPDKAGNRGELTGSSIAVQRDDVAPVVKNVKAVVQRTGQSARTYFQSNDQIFISFEVVEKHGVFASVNISELLVDAPAVPMKCIEKTGEDAADTFVCSETTPAIGQFNGDVKHIKLLVFDSAGNQANVQALEITVFGTDDDLVNPNLWQIKKGKDGNVTLNSKGLDAAVTKLIAQRVFATVEFVPVNDVEIVEARASCTGEHVEKSFMISNFRVENKQMKPVIVVEFEPFNPLASGETTAEIEVACVLTLVSKRGKQIVAQAEQETLTFKVKFFVTDFDNDISTIEETIDDARDDAGNVFLKVIGTLNEILTWAKLICNILNLLMKVWTVVGTSMATAVEATKAGGTVSFGATYATSIGICEVKGVISKSLVDVSNTLEMICGLVTCTGMTPKGSTETADTGVSGVARTLREHHKKVLDGYNSFKYGGPNQVAQFIGNKLGTDKNAAGVSEKDAIARNLQTYTQANSLYDNMFLSVVGICLPGIIYNLEKYRQIQCRYVSCLENEVKAGVATIESCRELKDYQQCKYVTGELFQIIPFVTALDGLLGLVKSLLTDPVGLVRSFVILVCSEVWCKIPSGPSENVCEYVSYFLFLSDLVNSIISTVQQIKTQTEKNYCEVVGL